MLPTPRLPPSIAENAANEDMFSLHLKDSFFLELKIDVEKTKQNIVHLLSHVRELRPRNLSSSSYTKSVSLSY